MHDPADAARTLRRRHSDLDATIARLAVDDGSPGAVRLVRTVSAGAYPTTSPAVFACQMLDVDLANENEGTVPTLTLLAGVFTFLSLGTTVPPVGTNLLVELVGGFWVNA